MNRKGFTLVELLATLSILAIVVVIGGVAISKTIKNTKEKNYQALVANIKNGAELYYQECNYGEPTEGIICSSSINLKKLVSYGYITSNTGSEKCVGNSGSAVSCVLKNPKDNKNLDNCAINIRYDEASKEILINKGMGPDWCPKEAHYYGIFD